MRAPKFSEQSVHIALAILLVAPLLAAFLGSGGFWDAFGAWQPETDAALSARRWALCAAAGNSLLLGGLSTALALCLGIPAGWALAQRGRPLGLLACCALPLALPASAAVSGWIHLLAPAGAASRFIGPIPGFGTDARGLLFSTVGAAFFLGTTLWPIVAFESWPAFRRARNQTYDAARLSASPLAVFRRVILPQCRREVLCGALLVFVFAGNDFTISSLLLVRSLPVEIHDALAAGKSATAAWIALPLAAAALVLAALIARLARNPYPCPLPYEERGARPQQASNLKFSIFNFQFSISTLLLVAAISLGFAIPLFAVLHGGLHGGRPLSATFDAGADALGVSLRLAAAAAMLALFLAILRVVVWPQSRAPAINTASLFLLAIPGPFLAAAVFALQLRSGGAAPIAFFAAAYVLRFMYLPLRLAEEGLAGLNPQLLESAALLGQGRLARAVSVALPLVAAHLAAAAALVFVLVLGEVSLAATLAPPGAAPATLWLFQQQHMGYDEAVFALSLLLGGVAAGAILAGGLAMKLLARGAEKIRGRD